MHDSDTDNEHPYELRPVLAEILRTCIQPDKIILRIEHVLRRRVTIDRQTEPRVRGDGQNKLLDLRLFLSDGNLLLQALLDPQVFEKTTPQSISVGDYIKIRKFSLKRARRKNGDGHVVYLDIQDCRFLNTPSAPNNLQDIKRNKSSVIIKTTGSDVATNALPEYGVSKEGVDVGGGGFIRNEDQITVLPSRARVVIPSQSPPQSAKIEMFQAANQNTTGQNLDKAAYAPGILGQDVKGIQLFHRPSNGTDDVDEAFLQPSQTLNSLPLKRKEKINSSDDEAPFETAMIDTNTAYLRRKKLLRLSQPKRLTRPKESTESTNRPRVRFASPLDEHID